MIAQITSVLPRTCLVSSPRWVDDTRSLWNKEGKGSLGTYLIQEMKEKAVVALHCNISACIPRLYRLCQIGPLPLLLTSSPDSPPYPSMSHYYYYHSCHHHHHHWHQDILTKAERLMVQLFFILFLGHSFMRISLDVTDTFHSIDESV
jgi:hypothetical protein